MENSYEFHKERGRAELGVGMGRIVNSMVRDKTHFILFLSSVQYFFTPLVN